MTPEEISNGFCILGEVPLKCKIPIFDEFPDEFDIMNIILSYFQVFLPQVMAKKRDARNRLIKIDPKDIGVTTQKDTGDYLLVLVPTDDNSAYLDENFNFEETEYAFQLQMEVKDEDSEGALENLIKLKSGVKTLLTNMDFNLGLNTRIDNFSYEGPYSIEGTQKIIRQGTYRFSILDNRYKK